MSAALVAFFGEPRLSAYSDSLRVKVLRLLAVCQKCGSPGGVQMRLASWCHRDNVGMRPARLLDLLRALHADGAVRFVQECTDTVETLRVEVADWLLRLFGHEAETEPFGEADGRVQQAVERLEAALRPPSKQTPYQTDYKRNYRVQKDLEKGRKNEVACKPAPAPVVSTNRPLASDKLSDISDNSFRHFGQTFGHTFGQACFNLK